MWALAGLCLVLLGSAALGQQVNPLVRGSCHTNGRPHMLVTELEIETDIKYGLDITTTVVYIKNNRNATGGAERVGFHVTLPLYTFVGRFDVGYHTFHGRWLAFRREVVERTRNQSSNQGMLNFSNSALHINFAPRCNHAKVYQFTLNLLHFDRVVRFILTTYTAVKRQAGSYIREFYITPKCPVNKFKTEVKILERARVRIELLDANYEVRSNTGSVDLVKKYGYGYTNITTKSAHTLIHLRHYPHLNDSKTFRSFVRYSLKKSLQGGELLVGDPYFCQYVIPRPDDFGYPKDIIFVLDRSGSMFGDKMRYVKMALDTILSMLSIRRDTRFNIIAFGETTDLWSSSFDLVYPSYINKAKRFINRMKARGLSNTDDALNLAFSSFSNKGNRARIIFFITDGPSSHAVTNVTRLLESIRLIGVKQVALYTLVFEDLEDTRYLELLSEQNRGFVRTIEVSDGAHDQIVDVYREIADTTTKRVEMYYGDSKLAPGTKTALQYTVLGGSETVICGRMWDKNHSRFNFTHASYYRFSYDSLSVRKWVFNATFPIDFYQVHGTHIDDVKRMWMYQKMKMLLRILQNEKNDKNIRQKVLEFSLHLRFVTPLTFITLPPESNVEIRESELRLTTPVDLSFEMSFVAVKRPVNKESPLFTTKQAEKSTKKQQKTTIQFQRTAKTSGYPRTAPLTTPPSFSKNEALTSQTTKVSATSKPLLVGPGTKRNTTSATLESTTANAKTELISLRSRPTISLKPETISVHPQPTQVTTKLESTSANLNTARPTGKLNISSEKPEMATLNVTPKTTPLKTPLTLTERANMKTTSARLQTNTTREPQTISFLSQTTMVTSKSKAYSAKPQMTTVSSKPKKTSVKAESATVAVNQITTSVKPSTELFTVKQKVTSAKTQAATEVSGTPKTIFIKPQTTMSLKLETARTITKSNATSLKSQTAVNGEPNVTYENPTEVTAYRQNTSTNLQTTIPLAYVPSEDTTAATNSNAISVNTLTASSIGKHNLSFSTPQAAASTPKQEMTSAKPRKTTSFLEKLVTAKLKLTTIEDITRTPFVDLMRPMKIEVSAFVLNLSTITNFYKNKSRMCVAPKFWEDGTYRILHNGHSHERNKTIFLEVHSQCDGKYDAKIMRFHSGSTSLVVRLDGETDRWDYNKDTGFKVEYRDKFLLTEMAGIKIKIERQVHFAFLEVQYKLYLTVDVDFMKQVENSKSLLAEMWFDSENKKKVSGCQNENTLYQHDVLSHAARSYRFPNQ